MADIRFDVRNFHQDRNGKSWMWSCLVCGDSRTNSRKARFGVTLKDGSAVCNCFNCGYANNFVAYLKDFHPNLYERYTVDKFLSDAPPPLYDLNHLVDTLKPEQLEHIFYMHNTSSTKGWVNTLLNKKIHLSKKSINTLYNIFKNIPHRSTNEQR